ncbi:expressed unknown protein [Seminavis robusta]|uniref:Uncharacterized protein n=1 Tax=Seminavis robusta TaxID=568900 RepID=A0A9N8EYD7_9STRA|nr:expressed unknown protein [Seminavis robusta]|eukprot:Sro2476_g328760.1 n/a (525) ;mRNA; f:3351-4925
MNFLRQKADTLLNFRVTESRDDAVPSTVEDAEMNAAIEEMKERLAEARALTILKRKQYEKEQEALQEDYVTAKSAYTDRLTAIAKSPLKEYLAATKKVRDYIVPGVVATLQAQLCLHVHGICTHSEAIVSTKAHASEIIYWYEDMVKQLRRDQADQEMGLMNKIVQAKVELGSLVDARKLRERKTEDVSTGTMRTLSNSSSSHHNRFARTVSLQKKGNTDTVRRMPSRKQFSYHRADSKKQHQTTTTTISTGSRQRIIRNVSRRGNAHQRPSLSAAAQGAVSLRKLQQCTSSKPLEDDIITSTGRQRPGNMPVQSTLSAPSVPSHPVDKDVVIMDTCNEEGSTSSAEESKDTANNPSGLEQPSAEILARREARKKARQGRDASPTSSPTTTPVDETDQSSSRGRPSRRYVQRTRSKSLSSKDQEETRRGGRKPPARNVSKDDSGILMESPILRRKTTHELLRGFSPTPPLMANSPGSSQSSLHSQEDRGISAMFHQTWRGFMSRGQHDAAKAPPSPSKRGAWVG